MVRKKGIKKGRNDSDSDSDDVAAQKSVVKPSTDKSGGGGLSRKQKRMEKVANKSKEKQQDIQHSDDYEEEDDEEVEILDEDSKIVQKKSQRDQQALSFNDKLDEEGVSKSGRKYQGKRSSNIKYQRNDRGHTESEEEEEEKYREHDEFQRLIPDDSDDEGVDTRKNKKKGKKEKIAEKVSQYVKSHQGKQSSKKKDQKKIQGIVESEGEEEETLENHDEFQKLIPTYLDEEEKNKKNKKKVKKEKPSVTASPSIKEHQGNIQGKNQEVMECEDEEEENFEDHNEFQRLILDGSDEDENIQKTKKKGKKEKTGEKVDQSKKKQHSKQSGKSNDQRKKQVMNENEDEEEENVEQHEQLEKIELDGFDDDGVNQKKKKKGKKGETTDISNEKEQFEEDDGVEREYDKPLLDVSHGTKNTKKEKKKGGGKIINKQETANGEENQLQKEISDVELQFNTLSLEKIDDGDGGGNMDQVEKKKGGKEKKKEKKDKKSATSKNVTDEMNLRDKPDENKCMEGEEEEEIMYGAPDEKVWNDKSHSQIESEKHGAIVDNELPTHGADGKKLSNKERKKMKKDIEAKERMEEAERAAAKASKEGAQFACSQTAVDVNDPHWCNSLDINIPSFNISAAGKVLFKDASLNIPAGRRIGFVAPNGRGKSTLLKMIASKDLLLPPKIDFLYVEQEVTADQTTAVEAVLMADKKRWNLLEEERTLTAAIDDGNEDANLLLRLQQVLEELSIIGSDAAEAKARRILYGLGFDGEMQTKATKLFSGGWRMRISLARALFMEPTLLMPTNHLDLNAVIWLDDYLQRWKKTLLIVSHDQDFLNSVCEEIMHIEDLKIVNYKGNYDTFKQMEKTKLQQQLKEWEKQEKMLRSLKKSGQSRAKATETVTKSAREPGARASKKKQDAAIATGTSAVVAKELIKRPREYVVKLEFAEVPEIARPVIEVHNVHFRYTPKHPVIFDNVDFGIDLDSRICIVGPNGCGKSTLLKLLIGELNPTSGEVRRNPRLRMGVYQQHFVDRLPMDKTAVQHLRDRFQDQDYQSVRNRLGKYGLEGHAHEVNMRDLSGGQKARVVFVELSLQRPHVLLLDEPTNNLDIETIDALIDAINEFSGGIVVVTHDARLIEQCNCTLWVVEKEGVTQWQEGFDDYKTTILREMEEKMAKEAEARRVKLEAAATARSDKLKEKLMRLELSKNV